MNSVVLVLAFLAAAHCAVEPLTFSALEADTSVKLVLFHDPAVEKSVNDLAMATVLSETAPFKDIYTFKVCDVTLPENEAAKKAGLTGGTLFTQTPEAGIDRFSSELTVDSFAAFHTFRSSEVSTDKVVSATSLDQLFAEAAKGPVIIKMFEEWCGHCKKMKKHYQFASADSESKIGFVEVECSKAGNTCAQFGVSGYPTVIFMNKNAEGQYQTTKYNGGRTHGDLVAFARNPPTEGEFTPYTGLTGSAAPAETEVRAEL